MSKTQTSKTPSTLTSKTAKATSKPKPAPAAKPVRTPKAATIDPAHKYETASPEAPCIACGTPWVHAKALCSSCFNRARVPMRAGLKGADLVAAIQAKIAKRSASNASNAAKPKGSASTSTAKATQPLNTVADALTANRTLYAVPDQQTDEPQQLARLDADTFLVSDHGEDKVVTIPTE